ncbi:spherical body protein, putative [Babesia ovis]|uniref:Spherical body protein, putative n=1 Tax=Babesia ovis TaxID=5869 RepID=A0A9W5TAU8_BABOV|nr:spherical body protein, putative [Babesia ovis]
MVKRKWGNGTVLIRGDTIKIDVSSTEIDNKDIIILDNVNLGEWIYRQYSIVISMLPTYVHVTVVDSKNQCILYDLIGDEYVTHVDVFTHLAFNRRFIVINTKKALGSGFVDIKRAYMHQESTEAVCYYDLNNIEGVQIINLLYSIRIKEPSASVAVGNSNNDGITGLTAPVHGNVKCANTMASLNVDDSNVVTVKDSSINTLSDDVDDSSINTVVDSDVMTPIVSSTNSTLDNNMVPVVDSTNSTLNSNVITSVAGSSDTLDNNVVPVAGSSNTMDSDVMTPIVSSTNSTLVDADINTLDGDLLPLFDSEIYTLIDDLLSRGYNGINTVADSDVMNPGVDSGNSAVADSGDNRIEDDVIVVDDDEMTDDDVILVHDDEMTDDDVILVDDVDDFNLAADNVEDLCTPQGENNEGGSIFEVFYQYFKQLSESDEI